MAKAGFFGGDPQRVMQTPVDIVMAVMQFEKFETDYEAAYMALNKEQK